MPTLMLALVCRAVCQLLVRTARAEPTQLLTADMYTAIRAFDQFYEESKKGDMCSMAAASSCRQHTTQLHDLLCYKYQPGL